MRNTLSKALVLALFAISVFSFAAPARAEEAKMVGVVVKIEFVGSGAVATLKDNKSGENVDISVSDDLTLDKFKDHRIVAGDEIRCKYEAEGGKNLSKIFRKTAGC